MSWQARACQQLLGGRDVVLNSRFDLHWTLWALFVERHHIVQYAGRELSIPTAVQLGKKTKSCTLELELGDWLRHTSITVWVGTWLARKWRCGLHGSDTFRHLCWDWPVRGAAGGRFQCLPAQRQLQHAGLSRYRRPLIASCLSLSTPPLTAPAPFPFIRLGCFCSYSLPPSCPTFLYGRDSRSTAEAFRPLYPYSNRRTTIATACDETGGLTSDRLPSALSLSKSPTIKPNNDVAAIREGQ